MISIHSRQKFFSFISVKNDGFIDEYALSQTTLEQVFLQFARQQEENEEEAEKEGSASHL